jgi:hypothetical protein
MPEVPSNPDILPETGFASLPSLIFFIGIFMRARAWFFQTFLLALLPAMVAATTLAPVTIADLYKDADIVAKVQILSGQVLGIGENACGAKYNAVVEEAYKGVRQGETIEFGNFYGYEVGNQYVLFLVRPGRTHEPMMSTNSTYMDARQSYLKRCAPQLRRHTVMHSGNGALPVYRTVEFNYTDAVQVPRRYVVLPLETRAKPARVGERGEYSEMVWVRAEDMSKLLNGLR